MPDRIAQHHDDPSRLAVAKITQRLGSSVNTRQLNFRDHVDGWWCADVRELRCDAVPVPQAAFACCPLELLLFQKILALYTQEADLAHRRSVTRAQRRRHCICFTAEILAGLMLSGHLRRYGAYGGATYGGYGGYGSYAGLGFLRAVGRRYGEACPACESGLAFLACSELI